MRKHLKNQTDIACVCAILAAVEAGSWDLFPRDTYNGFYCCIAVCRHAYRYVFRVTLPMEGDLVIDV